MWGNEIQIEEGQAPCYAVPLDPQGSQQWASWEARHKSLKNVKQMHKMLT